LHDCAAINRFELTATLIQRDVVRYSPSGVPLVDCVLRHRSEIMEAGQRRDVELEMPSIALQAVVHRLAACPLDSTYRFTGFLANRSKKSNRAIFHIIDFEPFDD